VRSEASVVITGAAHGIGAALAECFVRAGHRVAVLDRDAEGVEARAAALDGGGAQALPVVCDVTSAPACDEAMARVRAAFGGIDVLVNNAGITHMGLFAETDVEVLRRVMEVNFFGAVHATHAALPSLLERRGHVAALSSVAGFAPLATRSGYVASKHALHGFCETLRTEHARDGLRVTLVCPSFVRTDIGVRALGAKADSPGPARSGVGHEIEPAAAAETIYRGVARGRRLVWVGREARLSWWVWQLAPRLYERAMVRRALG
jgi:NAD(P)-dependent dehydrogenase (short-subunit alcohol dehydrogenase family)